MLLHKNAYNYEKFALNMFLNDKYSIDRKTERSLSTVGLNISILDNEDVKSIAQMFCSYIHIVYCEIFIRNHKLV